MKIDNFRNLRTIGDYEFAEVDVTTRFFMKKTTTVFRQPGRYWRWLHDGSYTRDRIVEEMHEAYVAKQLLEKSNTKGDT